jgi:hypothetical protein
MLKFLLGRPSATCWGRRRATERYEQFKRTYQRVSDHPAVQGAAGVVRARVEETVHGGHAADSHGREAPMLELVGIRRNALLDVVGNH